ncbi:MAG: glycosyltransferase family 2 protein [Treponema sp.]|jgi:glycosyltransferase involved in cell wall biosynthesis|nr:glycosyltransferase family 2 protein [Treponema sp.]
MSTHKDKFPQTRAEPFLMEKSRATTPTVSRRCRQKRRRDAKKRYVPARPLIGARPLLAIIVPCYNEQEALPETAKQLLEKVSRLISKKEIAPESKIVFVDDGSTDGTWNLIETYADENPGNFAGIKLSGNRGHQNALLCGLLAIKDAVDVSISIDADLQDDIDAIDEMLEKHRAGCEIVYGVRSSRKKDRFFKRATAQGFYRLMHFLGADIVYNHADFRLMGKNALRSLADYGEVNLFLRGIVPLLGYKTGVVYYERKERFAGESKYPLQKMLKFAFEGITSFSVKPVRFITGLGVGIFFMSLVMIAYTVIQDIRGNTVSGWSSTISSLWCIGGLILLSIGVVGEYIGKIYLETKRRPRFNIEKIVFEAGNADH